MGDTERRQREQVLAEARSWLGTAYHHAGRVKGAGVDCAMFLAETYERCGLIPHVEPESYPPDWALHRGEEKYLAWIERYCRPVETPQPGDIVTYQFGRCVSHAAIVVAWPQIIHSYVKRGCCLDEGDAPWLAKRQRGFWTPWG